MTVSCPACRRRYRVPGGASRRHDATFRCTACRHVFALDEAREGPRLLEPEDATTELLEIDEDDADEADRPARRRRAAGPRREPARARPTAARIDRTDRTPPGSARFAVRAFLGVVLVYAVLSIYLSTHVEGRRALFGRIPLIGGELSETRLDSADVQLTNVKGEFVRVAGDQLVFTVSGTATNNAPTPVRAVQVQARLFGAREERRAVFCGTPARDVSRLSLHEIALLQTLEPPTDWTLPPGAHTSFLVVFAQPELPVREFDVEVVAVRGVESR